MGKLGFLAFVAALAMTGAASAQQQATTAQPNSCQRFGVSTETASQDAIYLQAACVVARAGVTSPANGALSRDELISILMLMSLPERPTHHAS